MEITLGQQYNVGEKSTVILYTYIINRHAGTPSHMVVVIYYHIGYKYKATTWYLKGSSMVVTLGQQYNVGEKPTVILCTYINHHAQLPVITQHTHSVVHNGITRIVLMSIIVLSNHTRIGAWVNRKT